MADQLRILRKGLQRVLLLEESCDAVGVGHDARLVPLAFPQERALGVPPQHDLRPVGVPHHHQGIDLAVQRPDVVNSAVRGDRIEGRAEVTVADRARHDADLTAVEISKLRGGHPHGNRPADLLAGEVRTEGTVRLGEPAAHIATQTHPTGHQLGQRGDLNQLGTACLDIRIHTEA